MLRVGTQTVDLVFESQLAALDIDNHLVMNRWLGLHGPEFCLQFTVFLLKCGKM